VTTLHFPSANFISMFLRLLLLFVASNIPTYTVIKPYANTKECINVTKLLTKLNLPGHLRSSKITCLQMPMLLPSGTWYIKTMYTEKGKHGVNIIRKFHYKSYVKNRILLKVKTALKGYVSLCDFFSSSILWFNKRIKLC
jgi:hypothetical protein